MASLAFFAVLAVMDIDTHQRRNRRLTAVVLAFVFLLFFLVIFAVGTILGASPVFTGILAVVVTSVYILVTMSTSVDRILRASQARPANPQVREEKLLLYRVEEMAIAASMPMPKVYVQPSRDINAFAAGLRPEDAVVCVTTGALQQLDQEELEGVLAHEMSHIRNRDVRLATITVGVVGALAMIAEIGIRILWFGGGNRGSGRRGGGGAHPILIVVALLALVLAPILSRLTYLALSRTREYLADATGAQFTRNPEGLARALEKIRGDVPDDPVGSRTVASLYFANPYTRLSADNVLSTHPPLEKRIARLRGHA
ncbi:MAG TPA: M48 family metallopeptidase [Candidatus Thermoplasmatota archaeon]|nr:M48 family metallopeptidase [Candidatus Thermoplasmatota archaeon]